MDIEILWIVIGAVFLILGLVGCFLPVLPGPPLSFVGMLMLQLLEPPGFQFKIILLWAAVAALVTFLDYVIPIYGTKKFGGSKYGVWGSGIGLVIGLVFSPFGFVSIIIGPLVGAFIGEMISGTPSSRAFKAALGSFIGFLAGTFMKLAASSIMTYLFIQAVIWHYSEVAPS